MRWIIASAFCTLMPLIYNNNNNNNTNNTNNTNNNNTNNNNNNNNNKFGICITPH